MSTPDLAGMEPSAPTQKQESRPRRFGDYLLVELLGYGGMGEVWLAKQTAIGIDTFCVIKTIKPELSGDNEYRTRFVDEARVVVQLTHRNICHVFDVGVVGREYFFAMELVAGFDFRKLFLEAQARGLPIGEGVALHLVCEILEALDYAHRLADVSTGEPLHLVHRDVSLQNLLVSLEGEVKLIDFGLAKSRIKQLRTEVGVVHGKMAYMAPEQARGEHVDPRADQFAAAVVAYELLRGTRYYGDLSPGEISTLMIAGLYRPPGFASLPEQLRVILDRALSADREQRFPSCAAFRKALIACAAQRGTLGGSEDVRALLDRMFPAARNEHRSRMTSAAAAANAAIAVPVEQSERIAAARPRLPLTLAPRTLDVPKASFDAPHTEVERVPSTDSSASESHDTTEEVRAPTTSDSAADRARRVLDDRTDIVDRSPADVGLATLVAPALETFQPEAAHAPITQPERDAYARPRSRRSIALIAFVIVVVVAAGIAFAAAGGWSHVVAHSAIASGATTPAPTATHAATANVATASAATANVATSPTAGSATIASATTANAATTGNTASSSATSNSANIANAKAPAPAVVRERDPEPQVVDVKASDAKAKSARPRKGHGEKSEASTETRSAESTTAPTKPRPQLPASAPASLPELVRVLESQCADVVPCAVRMRARLVEANQSPDVDAVRTVRASAEQCFSECKANAP